jgi:2-desacetyl-2-hydroxyethyl bacteriochlorophyllide A dehydrogenase
LGYELTIEAPRRVAVRDYEEPALQPHEVRIETLHSGISAGTELTLFRGSNPYLTKSWDSTARLFRTGTTSLSFPTPAFGYEEVGRIVECGSSVSDLSRGDVVWGAWGHRSTHVAEAAWARDRLLPEGLDPVCGIFSQIGAIALNAVHDSQVRLTETVAVFGQGVPGLMITQLLKASGARVIAVDRLDTRLERARAHGADHVLNAAQVDAADAIRRLTQGRGADVSIEITGAHPALHEAIRATAYNSRVVVSGFFQGNPSGLFLGEEFHHNRITLVCSQIGGVAREIDHRWNRLRMDTVIMALQREGKVDFRSLITHRFPARELQTAYDLLDTHPEDAGQVVLDFEPGPHRS